MIYTYVCTYVYVYIRIGELPAGLSGTASGERVSGLLGGAREGGGGGHALGGGGVDTESAYESSSEKARENKCKAVACSRRHPSWIRHEVVLVLSDHKWISPFF